MNRQLESFWAYKKIAYIVLRGDDTECFFPYGYDEKKSNVLYSTAKDRISNAIISTCFKKHFHEVLNERRHSEELSAVLLFLRLIIHLKEEDYPA